MDIRPLDVISHPTDALFAVLFILFCFKSFYSFHILFLPMFSGLPMFSFIMYNLLIDLSPYYGSHFSCLFACLVIFYWLPDIINFTFLGDGYFCIPLNILAIFSGMLLRYLEAVDPFRC